MAQKPITVSQFRSAPAYQRANKEAVIMLFRFDANQEYQLQAIATVVGLFDGQMRVEKDLSSEPGAADLAAKLHAGIMKEMPRSLWTT